MTVNNEEKLFRDMRKELEKGTKCFTPNNLAQGEIKSEAEEYDKNLSAFFNASTGRNPAGFWNENGFTSVAPWCQIRSKMGLPFGYLSFPRIQLEDWSDYYKAKLWLGFELGPWGSSGILSFIQKKTDMIIEIAGSGGAELDMDITSLLPANVFSAQHNYAIQHGRGIHKFWIDNDLVGIFVRGNRDVVIQDNTEPYTVGVYSFKVPDTMPTLIELNVEEPEGTYPETTVSSLTPTKLRYSYGRPPFPCTYSLYKESSTTEWSALDTGGTVQTSHPVPIMGYSDKTVYFKADAGGDLDIEVYVGGSWEVLKSISPVTANELETVIIDAEMQAPLLRCVYTPTDADTINLGEVNLA